MRYFVYADSLMLDSFWAQLNCGLLRFWSAEKQKGASKTENGSQNVNGNLCKEADNPGLSATTSQTSFKEHTSRHFEDKVLHDYAFNEIYSYLWQEHAIQTMAPFVVGQFCQITANATFIALDFPPEEEDAAAQEASMQPFDSVNSYYYPGFRRQRWRKIWSAKRLLLLDNFLFVLDLTQLRDNPDILHFQYGGSITGVGLLTNSIEIHAAQAQHQAYLQLLQPYLHPSYKMLHVVRPMAVYYPFC